MVKKRSSWLGVIVRCGGVLLMLTLISLHLVSGLYAKYHSGEMTGGGAGVAAAGTVSILEHKAYFDTSEYTYKLKTDELVTGNTYHVIVPGMDIEKDPFIRLYGDNEVSYRLYLEIVSDRPEICRYTLSTEWSKADELFPAKHGGDIYVFQTTIRPHESRDISNLFVNRSVHIPEDIKNKENPFEGGDPFCIRMYAYIVQAD